MEGEKLCRVALAQLVATLSNPQITRHNLALGIMPQRMRSDPAAEIRGVGRHVADAVELAHRDWPERILARKQPASRTALQPPRSQQRKKLWREHGMPILAALAHLDTDQHALGINVADPQHDDLTAAQTGAIGDA
jgi:hypothetical protein